MSLEKRIEEKVSEFDAEFNKADEFLVTKFLPAETTVNAVHKVKEHYKQALTSIAEEAREEEKNKNAGKVNGTPCFEWMDSWLHSFEVQNQDKYRNLKKDFKDWLRKQPMSC